MAPVATYVKAMSSLSTIHTRGKKCHSWDCLTSSEQAGIVVSVVVTAIVFLFLHMYYCGRITIRHQELALRRQRRRRERRTNFGTQPHAVSLVQLPAVPHYPSENLVYTPYPYYSPGQIPSLQTQATRMLVPEYLVPAVAPIRPTTYVGLPIIPEVSNVQEQNNPLQPSERSMSVFSSTSSDFSSRYQSDWWRRLRRAFGLPVGRASTIASDSAPGTPIIPRPQPNEVRQESRISRSGRDHTDLDPAAHSIQERDHGIGNLGSAVTNQADGRHETSTDESPTSAAATVHSDDFDI
ncbi:hypothetical protein ACLX1H_007179 [Fusarium chlamydosporum]